MKFELYSDVILTKNVTEENLQVGDIGTVVAIHEVTGMETGYTIEIFDLLGNTVAIITVSESCLRIPSHDDRLAVRT